jgi:hypothetical protein
MCEVLKKLHARTQSSPIESGIISKSSKTSMLRMGGPTGSWMLQLDHCNFVFSWWWTSRSVTRWAYMRLWRHLQLFIPTLPVLNGRFRIFKIPLANNSPTSFVVSMKGQPIPSFVGIIIKTGVASLGPWDIFSLLGYNSTQYELLRCCQWNKLLLT